MTNTPVMNAEEKNQHPGRMAFCALVALKLAQADGKTGCSLQAENIFLVRWLQTASGDGRITPAPGISVALMLL